MASLLLRTWLGIVPVCLLTGAAWGQTPLRVFLRGGPKTHGEGEHDHPAFVADWTPLLKARGAAVEGALEFPSADQLAHTDVLVLYAADGGTIHGPDRDHLLAYLARGGGIVAIHDSVCGDDSQWFKTVIGGAWEHGHAKWATGTTDLYVRDFEHPITKSVANWRFEDELYTDLHMMPEAHVLMAGFQDVFNITPQMWTYEKDNYRAFVAIQGHYRKSFEHDAWRTLLLRGIAWAGKRDVDLLTSKEDRASLAYPTGGPLRPEAAQKSLVLHDGFSASLVAAEPLIVKPISLDWDPSGRLWVAETPGYPMKEEFTKIPAHDTISILEDKDGDGCMDSKRVFADGLDLVTSFVFHEDGVIALAAPNIFFLRDTNGDGVCDKREVLFTGFGYGDTHAVMSNARWGLDGWIYCTQGYSGNGSTDVRSADGSKHFGKIGNGIFRFKPDGSAIEIVSSYGSNTWGLDFTPDGELFFSMANGAHLRHVVLPERALARARLPGVETWADVPDHDRVFPLVVHNEEAYRQIDFIGGFTAASGCCVYDGGAWPEEFNGRIYVAEPTVNLVHEDVITPNGVTFKSTKSEEKEFIASKDLWFRPVHMRIGPDGAMYVLDFYNQAAVHNDTRGPQHGPTNAAVRPDRDHMHGRIWRVQHKAAAKIASEAFKTGGREQFGVQLIAALDSPNGWKRGAALRNLCEAGDELQVADKLMLTATTSKSGTGRIAALWALARRRELSSKDLGRIDKSSNEAVFENALAIAGEFQLGEWLKPLTRDLWRSPPRVGIRVMQALEQVELDDGVLEDLARRFVLVPEGNPLIASQTTPQDLWARSLALSQLARDPLASISANREVHGDFDPSSMVAELSSLVTKQRDAEKAGELVCLLSERASPAVARAALVGLTREKSLGPRPQLTPRLKEAFFRLSTSTNTDLSTVALGLAYDWGVTSALDRELQGVGDWLEDRAESPDEKLPCRINSLRTLLRYPDRRVHALGIADSMLGSELAPDGKQQAIEELARCDDVAAAGILARRFKVLPAVAREQAFTQIVRRPKWVEPLLVEIEAGRIVPNDLGPMRIAQLKNHGDEAVAKRAREVFDKVQGPQNKSTAELIAKILPIVEQPGDAVKGKELFKTNCATCHSYKGEGAHIGPDLTGMGAHGVRALLPVILDPNASVEAAYLEYAAVTTDDRMITGIIVRDTPQSVVLRATTGDTEIARDELVSLKSTGRSPMPVGLESIGPEGLRDVLAYLTSDYPGFRVLDLRELFNMCSLKGMYDPEKGPDRMDLTHYGVFEADGVPFEIRDPEKAEGGRNVVCLRGGMRKDWFSVKGLPKSVEVPVGFALEKMHVLGGIAAWGFPCRDDKQPCVKWTWVYDDGSREEVVLHDGVEFADWIGRRDVPGSKYVEDLVKPDSYGQIRTFDLAPSKKQVVAKILLESYDNHLSPTFVGLTAELAGAVRKTVKVDVKPLDVLIVGGGSSHDFERWFKTADLATLEAAKIGSTRYTEGTGDIAAQLAQLKVLCLTNNQPLAGDALRAALDKFFNDGGGLVLVHPATWFNWSDWPEYNARWVGGGAKSHEKYAPFDVTVIDRDHPLAQGVPVKFRVADELYETTLDTTAAKLHVIAVGRSVSTGKEYPVLWTVERAKGRTVCLTLGHDGGAHDSAPYKTILTNAIRWVESN